MSRSTKSPSLFGLAEGCKRFFIRSEFLYCSSAFLFSKAKKETLAKKKCFFSRKEIDPLLPGDGNHRLRRLWRRNSQVRRCLFTCGGWMGVLAFLLAFEGYRAQTPCDLYSLLLVISYHPPASCWGRSVFYWVGAFYWEIGFRYGVAGLASECLMDAKDSSLFG